MTATADRSITVGGLLDYLRPSAGDPGLPRWPPDAFGIAAILLQRSGSYDTVVSRWPPHGRNGIRWLRFIKALGRRWRNTWLAGVDAPLPRALSGRWQLILDNRDVSLSDLRTHSAVAHALLEVCAAADEACYGIGIPGTPERNAFDEFALEQLAARSAAGSTLCAELHPSRVIVLPKLHTPRNGISIRSISHNIGACEPGEIRPIWSPAPSSPDENSLNLLIIPWPYTLTPAQFARAPEPCAIDLQTMPVRYGFFEYVAPRRRKEQIAKLVGQFLSLLRKATALIGRIDGVVLPELSLAPAEFEELSAAVRSRKAFLLAGVYDREDGACRNSLELDVPLIGAPPTVFIKVRQQKHHRWCLDKSQIVQYSLGGTLDATRLWWEHMKLDRRELNFVSMRPWLTISTLICEDLARRDPVDEILRSVGPNLVIALLMDGPQLAVRWPARYATVLADDPGSSVLTVTSLGMAQLARAPGRPISRAVALWRDAKNPGPIELELAQGCGGLALSLAVETHEEWAADGRSDDGSTGYPFLAGVQQVPLG